MWKQSILSIKLWRIVTVFVIFCLRLSDAENDVNDGPCLYRDTINITSGFIDQHGDYHHEGTVYIRGSYAEYDYIIENVTNKITVESHIRGCVCMYKPCFRICCRVDERNCTKPKNFKVPTKDGDEKEINTSENVFGVLMGVSCHQMYSLSPEDYDYDLWYFSVSF